MRVYRDKYSFKIRTHTHTTHKYKRKEKACFVFCNSKWKKDLHKRKNNWFVLCWIKM